MKKGTPRVNVVFDGLFDRIRCTGVSGTAPFFSHDSRTLAYASGSSTFTLHVPDRMTGEKLSSKRGRKPHWYEKDNRLAWVVDNKPAHKDTVFDLSVYREDDLADYRELAFRTAWAKLRDRFYDRGMHGVDWKAVRDRYLPAARNASSYSVFTRVVDLMTGELDASHLGFWSSGASDREWVRPPKPHNWAAVTGHLGVRFAPGTFKVADVIPGSPAEGVLRVGDEIVEIDGRRVEAGTHLADILNLPEGRQVQLVVKGREADPVYLKLATYARMRDLIAEAEVKSARAKVDAATGGRVGYLAVRKMKPKNYQMFEEEVYSRCWGKDALVIDLRGNTGGFTADWLQRRDVRPCGEDAEARTSRRAPNSRRRDRHERRESARLRHAPHPWARVVPLRRQRHGEQRREAGHRGGPDAGGRGSRARPAARRGGQGPPGRLGVAISGFQTPLFTVKDGNGVKTSFGALWRG